MQMVHHVCIVFKWLAIADQFAAKAGDYCCMWMVPDIGVFWNNKDRLNSELTQLTALLLQEWQHRPAMAEMHHEPSFVVLWLEKTSCWVPQEHAGPMDYHVLRPAGIRTTSAAETASAACNCTCGVSFPSLSYLPWKDIYGLSSAPNT